MEAVALLWVFHEAFCGVRPGLHHLHSLVVRSQPCRAHFLRWSWWLLLQQNKESTLCIYKTVNVHIYIVLKSQWVQQTAFTISYPWRWTHAIHTIRHVAGWLGHWTQGLVFNSFCVEEEMLGWIVILISGLHWVLPFGGKRREESTYGKCAYIYIVLKSQWVQQTAFTISYPWRWTHAIHTIRHVAGWLGHWTQGLVFNSFCVEEEMLGWIVILISGLHWVLPFGGKRREESTYNSIGWSL